MNNNMTWKQKLDLLEDYITSNPEIYIDMHEVSIPEHLRDKFYEYFDDIRNTFVKDFFISLPVDVEKLCNIYNQTEKELFNYIKPARIELPIDLLSFLHNPKEGMVRWLYNRLFEVIQKKISLEDFEHMAENDLFSTAAGMYRFGYETWSIFTLILLLEPDKTFSVELDDEDNPVTGEFREIAFGRQYNHSSKRIPEFIFHSKKLNSYIAVKMPLAREVEGYYLPPEIPQKVLRDRTGDTSYMLDSRIMFISRLKNPNEIPVYAEIAERKFDGPDLLIEFLTEDDLCDTDKISQVQKRTEMMKPKRGSCIVIMNPDDESSQKSSPGNTELFSVGFNYESFTPIIEKLNEKTKN